MARESFSKKLLQFQFSLGTGNFNGGQGNTATINVVENSGEGPVTLRASAMLQYMGGPTSTSCECAVYGLPLQMMNQLTTLGKQFNANSFGQNQVQILAGDQKTGLSLVFSGNIWEAYMDGMATMPRVPFRFRAMGDWGIKQKMIPPTSVQGSADVAQIMQKLAGQANLSFENNGVNVKVNNPYLPGAVRVQISELAAMAGIQHIIDNNKLAIWPTGQSRSSGGGHVVSPATGMVGYPACESTNIVVKELFDPSISQGEDFTVQSDITAANGLWNCYQMIRELEVEMPGGRWFQTLYGTPQGQKTQTGSPH